MRDELQIGSVERRTLIVGEEARKVQKAVVVAARKDWKVAVVRGEKEEKVWGPCYFCNHPGQMPHCSYSGV